MTQLTIDDLLMQMNAAEARTGDALVELALGNCKTAEKVIDEVRKAKNMIELCLKEIKATQKLLDTVIADELK